MTNTASITPCNVRVVPEVSTTKRGSLAQASNATVLAKVLAAIEYDAVFLIALEEDEDWAVCSDSRERCGL